MSIKIVFDLYQSFPEYNLAICWADCSHTACLAHLVIILMSLCHPMVQKKWSDVTSADLERSNLGHWNFDGLYLENGAS